VYVVGTQYGTEVGVGVGVEIGVGVGVSVGVGLGVGVGQLSNFATATPAREVGAGLNGSVLK
jgi:hypothetical protein